MASREGLVHLRVVEGDRFTIYDVLCPAHFAIASKASKDDYACLLVGGSVEERFLGTRRKWKPGSLHFHQKGEIQAAKIGSEGVRCLSIAIRHPGEFGLGSVLSGHRWIGADDRKVLGVQAGRVLGLARRRHPSLSALDREVAMLFHMAGSMPRRPKRGPEWVSAIQRRLTEHPERPLSLDALAAESGLRKSSLCTGFRGHSGETIRSFQERQRVERATRMLTSSDWTIGEIAAALGFCDQSHFDRAFRRRIGATPSAFRSANT